MADRRFGFAARAGVLAVAAGLLGLGGACRRPGVEGSAVRDGERQLAARQRAARLGVEPLPAAGLELESDYSRVRLRDLGAMRLLYFVGDDGVPVVESRIDLERPHVLLEPYTRTMFASYLFTPTPRRVLLVGVGGGAMIRFLERYDPELLIDAVDIDPLMIDVAERYFGTKPSTTVRLLAADGYVFVRRGGERYDVIYLDAYLSPSAETDSSGAPRHLRQRPFYRAVSERLAPGGVVVFNLNRHERLDDDVNGIRAAFSAVHLFRTCGSENLIAVASPVPAPATRAELHTRAAALDRRFGAELSFATLVKELEEP